MEKDKKREKGKKVGKGGKREEMVDNTEKLGNKAIGNYDPKNSLGKK